MASKLTTSNYDLDLDATGWGTLRAEARISNVPSASPLLPIDGELKLEAKKIEDDVVRLTFFGQSIVDGILGRVEGESDIANESPTRRVAAGDGKITVGKFSHRFEFEGVVDCLRYWRSKAIDDNIIARKQRLLCGNLFHDLSVRVPLDSEEVIDTWLEMQDAFRNSPNFGDYIKDVWLIGPLWNALEQTGQSLDNIDVYYFSEVEGGEKSRIDFRFAGGGTGIVDSISRWLELFPIDGLGKPVNQGGRVARLQGNFNASVQGVEVKLFVELPGFTVPIEGGKRKILNHPLVPLAHHGIAVNSEPADLSIRFKVSIPKGKKFVETANSFEWDRVAENVRVFTGGRYKAWAEGICKGSYSPFDIFFG